jgi:hypothetical protein
MKPYGNRSGNSGVVAYDNGSDWISLQFVDGGKYKYRASNVGLDNLKTMKRLADSGQGLMTFINTHPSIRGRIFEMTKRVFTGSA